VALKETPDQTAHGAPTEQVVQKRNANDIRPANPGEVRNYIGRLGMTKHKPRLTLIAHPAFGLKGNPTPPSQHVRYEIQTREVAPGPAAVTATYVALRLSPPASQPNDASHAVPPMPPNGSAAVNGAEQEPIDFRKTCA